MTKKKITTPMAIITDSQATTLICFFCLLNFELASFRLVFSLLSLLNLSEKPFNVSDVESL